MTFCRNCGSSLPCTCAASYGPSREEIEYEREKRKTRSVSSSQALNAFKRKAWNSYLDGEYGDALEWIQKAIFQGDNLGECWNIKGLILAGIAEYCDSSAYKDSISAYDRALGYEPENSTFKNNRALCLYKWAKHLDENGTYEPATEKINEALELLENRDLDYTLALYVKGDISRHTGQLVKALMYYDMVGRDYHDIEGVEEKRNDVLNSLSNSKITSQDFKKDYPFKTDKGSEGDFIFRSAEKLYLKSEYLEVALALSEISFHVGYLSYQHFIEFKQNVEEKIKEICDDLLKKSDRKKLITITGTKVYNCPELEKGMIFKLKKEPENVNDENAIAVYLDQNKIGHVANGRYTTDNLTSKASDISGIGENARAEYLCNHNGYHIARLI